MVPSQRESPLGPTKAITVNNILTETIYKRRESVEVWDQPNKSKRSELTLEQRTMEKAVNCETRSNTTLHVQT